MNITLKQKAIKNKKWVIDYLRQKYKEGNIIGGTISDSHITLHYNNKSLWCNLQSNLKYFKKAILEITK